MKTIQWLFVLFFLFALFLGACSDNIVDPKDPGIEEPDNGNNENDESDEEDESDDEGLTYCCVVSFGGEPGDGSATFGSVIVTTPDGGYVMAGSTTTYTGDFEGINEQGNDIIFLQKLNSDLERVWIQTIGGSYGPNNNRAYDLQHTSDGGFVVSGSFSSNDGDFAGNAKGVRSIYIWKTDSNGETEWLKTLGGTDWEDANNVRETMDGGFIVTGRSASNNLDFEGLRARGTNYMFLLKLNKDGSKEWLKSYSNSPQFNDYAYAVAQSDDGGYYMGGSLQPATAVLIKTDVDGETEWVQTIDHIASASIRHIEIFEDGNLLVAGNSILMKMDPLGEILWESDLRMAVNGLTMLENGSFLIALQARGDLSPFTDLEHQYVMHMGLLKFDTDGNLIWKSAFGGTGWEVGYSVTPSPEGGYVALGLSSSNDGLLKGLKKGTHRYVFVVRTDDEGQPIVEEDEE